MLKSYVKLAFRVMRRSPGYTLINVVGLSLGLACCTLISLFVLGETRVDDFHANGERLYRLNKVVTPDQGEVERHVITSGLMGPALVEDFPDVEEVVRVLPWYDDMPFARGNTAHLVRDAVFVDANFFTVFDFPLLRGDPDQVLSRPMSVVLTASTAKRLFGDADPMGEALIGLNDQNFTVTGIADDPPLMSHLKYDALISWSSTVPDAGGLEFLWMNNWLTQTLYTYVQMRPGAEAVTLEEKLPAFMQRHFPERVRQYQLYFQPFRDIYLGSADLMHSRGIRQGSRANVLVFGAIALAVLFIACVNFINLSTARASRRAREVGVRKVVGASRRQLVRQFVGESLLTAFFAVALAWGIVQVTIPYFEAFTGKALDFSILTGVWLTISLVGGTLAVGLLAGLYPALVLSRFRPATMLRNAAGAGGGSFRRSLVVGQFAVSIALIAGTFVVLRQLDYLESKDLGFDPEQVVVLPTGDTSIRTRFDAFRQAVLSHPSVLSAAGSSAIPGQGMMGFGIVPEGVSQDQTWTAWSLRVDDDDLLDTYGVDLVSGRYFSEDLASDSSAVVINKALADALGWTDPIGKRLDVVGEVNGGVVVGVVEDFHYESLHHAIDPLVFFLSPRGQNLSVRVNDVAAALAHLEKTWKAFEPRYPFDYYFVDESFAAQYEAERRLSTTISIFAALAVLIACLGLLGLASFTAEQRRKEIGVRKVLGATAAQIVLLLSQDFIRLVAIAFLIGAPLAFFAMTRWLDAFAYKVPVGPGIFIIAGLAAAIVALAAIGSQSARAALANPTCSLRNE